MSQKYEKLRTLLQELFQLDQPDLDFGIYRILHAKADEITNFLDRDLLPQVKDAFAQYKSADKSEIEREIEHAIASAKDLGIPDPESTGKLKQLRERLATEAVDVTKLEGEVYDHLYGFFRRYYSEGDFLSKRVYKPGVYAIPYEGEEVKLHWANADQYYIKTSEYLRDYAFRLNPEADEEKGEDPMRVHFRLVEAAEGEHGNVKEGNGKERRFVLRAEDFLSVENGELVINFEYRPATLIDWPADQRDGQKKPPAQDKLREIAEKRILGVQDAGLLPWISELNKNYRKTDGTVSDDSTLLVNLKRYTARNTFDYFIHKDLGEFLRRELDFYVKNEVMHLDDIESDTAPRVEQYLSKIKVIRSIAHKIIDFLVQIEDFQRKLWLKKKFVVETSYLIRIGIIPEEFYPEIAANDAQREEWVRLLAVNEINGDLNTPAYSEPLTVDFLKAFPSLMVDGRLFSESFNTKLMEAIAEIDSQTDGVLFHSENFQALSLMQTRYRGEIDCTYIDPPYNTSATEIIYKNSYKHSSWLTLLENRLKVGLDLCSGRGNVCVTIDDFEFHRLRTLLEDLFPPDAFLGLAAIKNNPSGRATAQGFSIAHEYAVFMAPDYERRVGRLPHTEEQRARYGEVDDEGQFEWVNFRKHGGANANRYARPKLFYPIFVSEAAVRIPQVEWVETERAWVLRDHPRNGEEVVYPVTPTGDEKTWKWGIDTAREQLSDLRPGRDQAGRPAVYRKSRLQEGTLPRTVWDKSEYSSTEYGTNLLADIFGEKEVFSFPKSVHAVKDCLRVCNAEEKTRTLDYFAGSGTTGHAVIALNREDDGGRSFVLVESGQHFEFALIRRLKKITFSPEWVDGKPRRLPTQDDIDRSPRIMKIVVLESYEDAISNLDLRRAEEQEGTLFSRQADGSNGFREQYMLQYMLDVESRRSQSLLNIENFADPTAYKLKVKRPGSDESREVNVDLIETFNWLIGLTVQHIAAPRTFAADFERDTEGRLQIADRLRQDANGPFWFRTVTGTTPDGRKTLVIWRKLTGNPEEDNLVLDEWFTRQGYSSKDSEFDLIYVNGDNNLENLRAPDDTSWKVRLIEEDFHRLMFDTEDV